MENFNKRNTNIDLFRYVCAIMVLSIHTGPFYDVNSVLGYVFTEVITRVAVPFFFAVSGYFYIKKLYAGEKPLLPYLKRIIIVYSLWSIIYFIFKFVNGGYVDVVAFLVGSLKNYLLFGSHVHLWYFPALIISVLLITFFYKIRLKKSVFIVSFILYLVGCIACAYYNLATKIPGFWRILDFQYFTFIRRVFLMGFPFFISGFLAGEFYKKYQEKLKSKALIAIMICSIIIWVTEILLGNILKLQQSIVITIGLYPLVFFIMVALFRYPTCRISHLSKGANVLANFTYYSHPLFIMILDIIFTAINWEISGTLIFFMVWALTFFIGLILYKINNKYVNKLII